MEHRLRHQVAVCVPARGECPVVVDESAAGDTEGGDDVGEHVDGRRLVEADGDSVVAHSAQIDAALDGRCEHRVCVDTVDRHGVEAGLVADVESTGAQRGGE